MAARVKENCFQHIIGDAEQFCSLFSTETIIVPISLVEANEVWFTAFIDIVSDKYTNDDPQFRQVSEYGFIFIRITYGMVYDIQSNMFDVVV